MTTLEEVSGTDLTVGHLLTRHPDRMPSHRTDQRPVSPTRTSLVRWSTFRIARMRPGHGTSSPGSCITSSGPCNKGGRLRERRTPFSTYSSLGESRIPPGGLGLRGLGGSGRQGRRDAASLHSPPG